MILVESNQIRDRSTKGIRQDDLSKSDSVQRQNVGHLRSAPKRHPRALYPPGDTEDRVTKIPRRDGSDSATSTSSPFTHSEHLYDSQTLAEESTIAVLHSGSGSLPPPLIISQSKQTTTIIDLTCEDEKLDLDPLSNPELLEA